MFSNSLVVLDRDGVINRDYGYVHRREDFDFMPGIFEICSLFAQHGMILVVATNQSGIGRKIFTESQFEQLSHWMKAEFSTRKIEIAKIYHCPHLPGDLSIEMNDSGQSCFCRKPNPGMLFEALADFRKHPGDSIIIGDKDSDMLAGLNAGFGTRILIGNQNSIHATAKFPNLREAIDYFRAMF